VNLLPAKPKGKNADYQPEKLRVGLVHRASS
jgi:hypothetical protein